MKNIYLLLLLLVTQSLSAQIIPMPRMMKVSKKHNIFKLVALKHDNALIQTALTELPFITFGTSSEVNIQIKIKREMRTLPVFKMDEKYKLTIKDKKILIEASHEYGALHALSSLKQLKDFYLESLPDLVIEDHPRFPWRGLLIDVARNWIEISTLKNQIDLMKMVKLNVLHLHLSDDQAFRIESKIFPKLHTKNKNNKFYTLLEIKDLITYAGERGIRIVPEFDVPGHTTAILASYPELASKEGTSAPSIKYGPHDEAMNPIIDETYDFLERLFTEMSALFPDEYFHVGGDEVSGKHWMENPSIVSYMEKNKIKSTTELQFRFTRKMEALIHKLGKKMIAWDEVLKEKEHLSSVAQIWRGPKFGKQALDLRMPVIYSYGYYLDLLVSAEKHYLQDPSGDMGLKNDPLTLWGGEACIWSERVTDDLLTERIWPRAMAIAERLWSPRSVKDVKDFYTRMDFLSQKMGLNYDVLNQRIVSESPAWGIESEAMKSFFSWLEPGKFYSQHRYRTITVDTPWNQWVDLIPSESVSGTKLNWVWKDWKKNKNQKSLNEMQKIFQEQEALSLLLKKVQSSEEMVALTKDIGGLARMALDALSFLEKNEKPGSQWFMENRTKLGMMGQIRSGMQISTHSVVEEIVYYVADKHDLPSR